ncbi:MAG: hypothetical protein KDC38_05405 [Planctomycetes bacterium]|nr:hypothetical protein [Planctomycetota bacterium]
MTSRPSLPPDLIGLVERIATSQGWSVCEAADERIVLGPGDRARGIFFHFDPCAERTASPGLDALTPPPAPARFVVSVPVFTGNDVGPESRRAWDLLGERVHRSIVGARLVRRTRTARASDDATTPAVVTIEWTVEAVVAWPTDRAGLEQALGATAAIVTAVGPAIGALADPTLARHYLRNAGPEPVPRDITELVELGSSTSSASPSSPRKVDSCH